MRGVSRRWNRQVLGSVALGVVAGTALWGCSSGADEEPSRPEPMSWVRIVLPGGITPVTVSPMGDGLLVGARDETAHLAPRLLVLDNGSWSSIPLHPSGFYAYRARWRSVITDGTRIYAVGDAPGGAHSNPRWTSWQGDLHGMTEYPQFFETFGGPGAGGLTGMAFSARSPEILGSWTSDSVGLDIVSWTLHGTEWRRGSSTGTVLASNEHRLNVIRAVGQYADGTALAGAVSRLGNGHVSLDPAVWRSTSAAPWVRIDLPAVAPAQATDVRCVQSTCLAAGYINHRLAVWRVSGEHAELATRVPYVHLTSESVALVGPAGAPTQSVLTTSRGSSLLLTQSSDGWALIQGPTGTATAWAAVGGHTYVITGARDGSSTLWMGDLDRSPPGG